MKPLIVATLLTVALSTSYTVNAATDQDAAYRKGNGFISDSFGKCVRTKWQAGDDVCNPAAPEPEKAAAPAAPAIFASKAERTIYFDFNSAKISDEEKIKLASLAKIINSSTRITDVRVVGYTDQFGSDSYNQKLSQRRVDEVTKLLGSMIRLNIKPEKMDLYGAGKATETQGCKEIQKRAERIACMKEERRVEIVLNRQYVTE